VDKIRAKVQAASALETGVPDTRTGEWRFPFGVTMLQ
jgi:hypothetical protein